MTKNLESSQSNTLRKVLIFWALPIILATWEAEDHRIAV
jgi:hypothetical protein